MSELTKEQYEELPDFMKENYVEDGDGFSHKGLLKVKQTANELDSKSKEAQRKLDEMQAEEAAKIKEAEDRAYEKAKAEGNTEEIETRLTQKLEDAERRHQESEKQFQERMKKLADKQREAISAKLASELAVKGGEKAYEMLVSRYIEVDPETDEVTYLDGDGRATSLNSAEFKAELKKKSVLLALTKADISTNGGGNANGSNSGGRATKKPSEMNSQERIEFKQRDPVGFKQAFNLN